MRKFALLAAGLFLGAMAADAQLGTSSPTGAVTIAVGAESAMTIQTTALNLTQTGSNFSTYTGSTSFTYFVRTSKTGGSGAITLKVTSDFSPTTTHGPSVGTPATAGDTLSYTCTAVGSATACSGSQTASTAASTPVVTFGTDAHSPKTGSAGSTVAWALSNDPLYPTGSYTTTVTYTISAS